MAKKYLVNETTKNKIQQMLNRGPKAPFTRLTFREDARSSKSPLILVDAVAVAGSATASPANWRYNLKRAFTDEVLLADVDPSALPHRYQRPPFGLLKQAKAGFVVVNPDANQPGQPPYIVWDINEVPNASTCPATP